MNTMNPSVAMISEHASPVALLGGVDAGGQNVYVDAVCRGLAGRGYRVDVFTRNAAGTRPEVVPWADGVRVISIPFGPAGQLPKDALWPFIAEFRDGIARFAARTNRTYAVIHGNFWMSGWVASALRSRWTLPAVQIFHATGVTKRREQGAADTSPPSRVAVERAVVSAVDRLIAQCPEETRELIEDYAAPPRKIALIPSAVDISTFRPEPQAAARRRLGLHHDAQIVAYIGRIVPRKDIRNVVRALAILKQRQLDKGNTTLPNLVLVGGESEDPDPAKTPEIGHLRRLAAELGVSDLTQFVGRKQASDLRHWYAAADVAVTTPWYEPFGLTPLEAMACATPVIGSRVGGIGFTIVDGETGFLVPPKNPEALARSLERLLADADLRQRMGKAGRARIEREFTWPTVASRTAALYGELLSDPQCAPHFRDMHHEALSIAAASESGGPAL
jgi:glycosyltransferase involved in cell wall biosynthesis